MRKILYKVLNWGLGHYMRSLPILRELVGRGHEVTVASSGRIVDVVRLELGDAVRVVEAPDINSTWGRECHWILLLPKLWLLPDTLYRLRLEKRWVAQQVRREGYDLVLSDSCFGAACPDVPSYLLGHHLRVYWFLRYEWLARMNEWALSHFINAFDKILVPDYDGEDNLAGSLAHGFKTIDATKIRYIGILSDFQRIDCEQDIDVLFSISGAEPQRTVFRNSVMSALDRLEGKIAVTCGRPEMAGSLGGRSRNVEVYEFLTKPGRDELMNRARTVVSRAGYSTIMDLAQLGKRALLIPQRNQTEQEYLACYHRERGNYHTVDLLKQVDWEQDIMKAREYGGLSGPRYDTAQSVARLMHHMELA